MVFMNGDWKAWNNIKETKFSLKAEKCPLQLKKTADDQGRSHQISKRSLILKS